MIINCCRHCNNITHLYIPLEDSQGKFVIHPTLKDIALELGASLKPARLGNGADFDGTGQYMTLGEFPNQCIGQLEHCKHGITVKIDVNPRRFLAGRDTYIMSTQSYDIYYRDGRLVADFRTPTKQWTVSSDKVRQNEATVQCTVCSQCDRVMVSGTLSKYEIAFSVR